MGEPKDMVMPCGCHIFVDHDQGDRLMACVHLVRWNIRAHTQTTVTYQIINPRQNEADYYG